MAYRQKKSGGMAALRWSRATLALAVFCLLTSAHAAARSAEAGQPSGLFAGVEPIGDGSSAPAATSMQRIAQLKPIPPWKPPPQAKTPRKAKTPRQAKTPRPTKPIRQAKQPATPDIPLSDKCKYLQPEEPGSEAVKLACKKAGYPTPYWPQRQGQPAQSNPEPDQPSTGERIGHALGGLVQSEYDKAHGKAPRPNCTNSGDTAQEVKEILAGCQ